MATIKAKLAAHLHSPAVLPLAEELVAVTELEPAGKDIGKFIGKCINRDGSIALYPKVTWWRQSVAQVPATIDGVFKYLCEARTRNICLIRGAPAKLERQPTRRHLAYKVHRGVDRGDHGFVDEPTRLFFLDVDGFPANWIEDPEHALKALVEQLGEPFASASVVWFFSATHGLKRDTNKRWTGGISDGGMRVRLAFLTTRALDEAEALKLTALAQAGVSAVDSSISRTVQPNYIKRPLWLERPERDPLGEIATIGLVRGANEYLAVPDDLPHKVRWAKAQGQGGVVVQHPDAESAVRGIGSDGHVRSHMTSAVVHLLRANPTPEKADRYAHSINIVEKLREMIEQHREEIENNLAPHGRGWGDVAQYLPDNMVEWSIYVLDNPLDDHPGGRNRKTVKLVKAEEAAPPQCDEIRKRVRNEIRERVEDTIKHFCGVPAEHRGWEWGCEWLPEEEEPVMALTSDGEWVVVPAGWLELPEAESPKAELVVAPTGSGKSMWMRYAAVES